MTLHHHLGTCFEQQLFIGTYGHSIQFVHHHAIVRVAHNQSRITDQHIVEFIASVPLIAQRRVVCRYQATLGSAQGITQTHPSAISLASEDIFREEIVDTLVVLGIGGTR